MSAGPVLAENEIVDVPGNPRPDGARIIWFEGAEGRRLRACICAATTATVRGTAIVCPGRTEFIEKYFEVARDLQSRGFVVLILDWPGQGLSDRLLPNARKGHIDRFETYMNALAKGLAGLQDKLPRPYVSLAHSMGGAITLAALVEEKVKVDAAAFCAPMWGIKSPFLGARLLVRLMKAVGGQNSLAQKDGPNDAFERNALTSDRRRWQINEDLILHRPELGLGPATWGWVAAALDINDAYVRDDRLKSLDIPVFVASAGREKLVDNAAQKKVVALLPNVEHITIKDAMHEILMEQDPARNTFWAGFDRMLDRAGI